MGERTQRHKGNRQADSRDTEVGRRVRSRRLECRLTLTELANEIGVTYQQVQQYEKGTNRLTAGQLERVSKKLGVPISFFLDNMDGTSARARAPRNPKKRKDSVFELMQTSGAVRILKAFHRIQTRKVRAMLIGNKVTDSQGRPERPEWTRRGAAVAMVTDPRSV